MAWVEIAPEARDHDYCAGVPQHRSDVTKLAPRLP
jgi:hypothetical protein